MSDSGSLMNVGDLAKPVDTLVERISALVEGAFKPVQIRRGGAFMSVGWPMLLAHTLGRCCLGRWTRTSTWCVSTRSRWSLIS